MRRDQIFNAQTFVQIGSLCFPRELCVCARLCVCVWGSLFIFPRANSSETGLIFVVLLIIWKLLGLVVSPPPLPEVPGLLDPFGPSNLGKNVPWEHGG